MDFSSIQRIAFSFTGIDGLISTMATAFSILLLGPRYGPEDQSTDEAGNADESSDDLCKVMQNHFFGAGNEQPEPISFLKLYECGKLSSKNCGLPFTTISLQVVPSYNLSFWIGLANPVEAASYLWQSPGIWQGISWLSSGWRIVGPRNQATSEVSRWRGGRQGWLPGYVFHYPKTMM